MPKFSVILPAAGQSSRFKGKRKKPFEDLDGRAIWVRCAELFINRDDVCQTIIVIAPEDDEEFKRRFQPNLAFMGVKVVHGGAERADSVANALEHLSDDAEYIAIHDAARPCAQKESITKVFESAAETGAAVLAHRIVDTLKREGDSGTIDETVARAKLWAAQTPQVFKRDVLLNAYENRSNLAGAVTDDAQLVEASGYPVTLVEGPATNIKITTKSDITLAKAVLNAMPKPKAKKQFHPFQEDRMWGGDGGGDPFGNS